MVCIYVLVGQAGIQVGIEFWKLVNAEYARSHSTFFNRAGKARCLLIDSEPKVVRKALSDNGDLFFDQNAIYDQPGRGNNWAYGYYDKKTNSLGETLADRAMSRIEWEFSHSPSQDSPLFVVIHSLAGGTGSGLGSQIISCIREKYLEAIIFSAAVTPFEGGEVVLQSYNCSLCLAELVRKTDAIVLLSNERAMKSLEKLRAKLRPGKRDAISLHELNVYFAKCMAGLFFPTNAGPVDAFLMKTCMLQKYKHPWEKEQEFDAADFVRKMCPNNLAKFVELHHAPCYPDGRDVIEKKWSDIATEMTGGITPRFVNKNMIKTIKSQLIIRGDKSKSFVQEYPKSVRDKLLKCYGGTKPEEFQPDIRVSLLPTLASSNFQQSITVCTNRNSVTEVIENTLRNAQAKFSARAYVHWYHRYGCSDAIFVEAFKILQNVIEAYA